MPPVILGATSLIFFAIALAARKTLVNRHVTGADPYRQTRRQFTLDVVLYLAAGVGVVLANSIFNQVPLEYGGSYLVGCVILGFFTGLDTALARERVLIKDAMETKTNWKPPVKLYPVTHKFSYVAMAASAFIVVILTLAVARDFAWLAEEGRNAASVSEAQTAVIIEIMFIMAVVLGLLANLIISYSKNLKMLFNNETSVLEQVSNGDLSRMVPVVTNDEFGYIAGHTNAMIEGLRHRSRLVSSLQLAQKVQESLLPDNPPTYPGVDIAGTSIYCDQTGGDYYDYFPLPGGLLGVVVADSAGHGVGSALHMTTARAFFKYGIQHYRGPADYMESVNHYLTRDSEKTGRFVSAFFLELDLPNRSYRWVRAGHEPAYVFKPGEKNVTKLSGKGIALGVMTDQKFPVFSGNNLQPGQVLVIGTDGIREAMNHQHEMYGAQRLFDVIRENATLGAVEIQKAVLTSVRAFQGDMPQDDDVTIVVLKIQ
ncbi:MAG: SpoIIE family protein phosphatase [Desulfobacteraceae bacterium]|nr:SpoIIE family protein phosphatase [Desulfobacteraceae bacterium]